MKPKNTPKAKKEAGTMQRIAEAISVVQSHLDKARVIEMKYNALVNGMKRKLENKDANADFIRKNFSEFERLGKDYFAISIAIGKVIQKILEEEDNFAGTECDEAVNHLVRISDAQISLFTKMFVEPFNGDGGLGEEGDEGEEGKEEEKDDWGKNADWWKKD